jgi:hypothetical protein
MVGGVKRAFSEYANETGFALVQRDRLTFRRIQYSIKRLTNSENKKLPESAQMLLCLYIRSSLALLVDCQRRLHEEER